MEPSCVGTAIVQWREMHEVNEVEEQKRVALLHGPAVPSFHPTSLKALPLIDIANIHGSFLRAVKPK
jgi:hypothetical protein